ncbi:carbohydrate kinase family protein [Thermogladius sp. 4427co]|uniref:carbohydrate kinase family protein n=1 Tax=Thermogladius sp. 4427co TaxID=3450718 RepID=UPI003F791772
MAGEKRGSGKPIHLSIGNVNIDLTFYIDRLPGPDESVYSKDLNISPGGAALNYAVAATYYGHYVYLIAAASTQTFSKEILDEVKNIGVDVRYVKLVEEPPGVVAVFVLPDGEKLMVKYRGANTLLTFMDVPRFLIKEAAVVHMASIDPRIAAEIAEVARRHASFTSYDPGVYALTDPGDVLKVAGLVNVLFLNKAEAEALGSEKIIRLLNLGIDYVIVKKGGEGAVAISGTRRVIKGYLTPVVKPVNTTGSGDAFNAFFNAAYIDWKDPLKALQYALSAGALKTMCRKSIMCWDKNLFNKQLEKSYVEDLGRVDESRIGDLLK